jgi:hypothetical protein
VRIAAEFGKGPENAEFSGFLMECDLSEVPTASSKGQNPATSNSGRERRCASRRSERSRLSLVPKGDFALQIGFSELPEASSSIGIVAVRGAPESDEQVKRTLRKKRRP